MGKISQLPVLDRPREKAYKYGVSSLSDYELLAIIISSGCKDKSALEISMDLILSFNGINNLFNTSFDKLIKCEGISKVKALTILVIKELFVRFSQSRLLTDDNIKLSSANDVYNYSILKYYDLNAEKGRIANVVLKEISGLSKETKNMLGKTIGALFKEGNQVIRTNISQNKSKK